MEYSIVFADSGRIVIYFQSIVEHRLHVWYPLSYLIIRIDDIVPSFWLYILLCHNLLTARTRLQSLCVSRTRRRRCWASCATRRCWRWPARCWPRSPGRTSSATSPAASSTTWWSSRRTTGPRSRTSGSRNTEDMRPVSPPALWRDLLREQSASTAHRFSGDWSQIAQKQIKQNE